MIYSYFWAFPKYSLNDISDKSFGDYPSNFSWFSSKNSYWNLPKYFFIQRILSSPFGLYFEICLNISTIISVEKSPRISEGINPSTCTEMSFFKDKTDKNNPSWDSPGIFHWYFCRNLPLPLGNYSENIQEMFNKVL